MTSRMTPFELFRFSKAIDYANKKEDLSRRFGGDYISKHPEAEKVGKSAIVADFAAPPVLPVWETNGQAS